MSRRGLGLVLLVFTLSTYASAVAARQPNVDWRIDMRQDKAGHTHATVYFVLNGHSRRIVHDVEQQFCVIDSLDYPDDSVPRSALTACKGWNLDYEDIYYAVRHGRTVSVYHCQFGNVHDPQDGHVKRIATMRLY